MIRRAGPVSGRPGRARRSGRTALSGMVAAAALLPVSACQTTTAPFETLQSPQTELSGRMSYLEAGRRLLQLHDWEPALRAFNMSMINDGISEDALVGAAAANFRLGRLKMAHRLLLSAAERYPGSAVVRNNLGAVYYRMGDLANARASFEAAYALKSGMSQQIAQNIAMLEAAEKQTAKDDVEVVPSPFYVVPMGDGLYRLEQSEGTTS